MKLDEKTSKQIIELVTQGIIASKSVESNFFGVLNKHIVKHDEYAIKQEEKYINIMTGISEIKSTIKEVQDNHANLKEEHRKLESDFTTTKQSSSTGLKIIVSIGGIFIAVLGYFAIKVIDINAQVSSNTALIENK